MRQDHIIELNGKRYDALTGTLLGKSAAPVAEPLAPAVVSSRIRSFDGMIPKYPVKAEAKPAPGTHAPKTRRQHASSTVKAHQPQRANTLMRRAVHKPKTTPKPAIKTQIPHEIAAAPMSAITQKRSVKQIDPVRVQRAHQTPKHREVSRFTHSAAQGRLSAPAIQSQALSAHAVTPMAHHSSPAPKASRHSRDIFEEAIAQARSHEQPAHKAPKHRRKHGRLVGTLAGIAAFVVLGGFLVYLNMPGIELRVASFQAGFRAELPDYSPTGYKLANIEHKHGVISLSFRSGESTYQITQQPSDWNSQTLRDDLIATADHEVVESHGRIIYIKDNSASWVSSGVRYDITGNAHLTKDDIVDIVTSM